MRQAGGEIRVGTAGKGLYEITDEIVRWLEAQKVDAGLLTLFCRHTSASLVVQENASPDVMADLQAWFEASAPEESGRYVHEEEGPDDMPAHIRSALTGVSLSIPISGGRMTLGAWQGVFLFEHRRAPHQRRIAVHLIGE